MKQRTTKGMESLGDAAARLLGGLERRRKKASERLTTSSEQIGRDDLDRLFSGTGNAPAVPQIVTDADEQAAAKDHAASATFSGLEPTPRANQTTARDNRRRGSVWFTFSGGWVIAANQNFGAHSTLHMSTGSPER